MSLYVIPWVGLITFKMADNERPVEEELRRFSADFKLSVILPTNSPETKSKRAASCADIENLKAFSKNFVLGEGHTRRSIDLTSGMSSLQQSESWYSDKPPKSTDAMRNKQVPDSLSIQKSPLLQQRAGTSSGGKKKTKKKKRPPSLSAPTFEDKYVWLDEILGKGAFAVVRTCRSIATKEQFAAKVIEKRNSDARPRVFKEVEILYKCKGHENILQLKDYFETNSQFYLIFEKMEGGPLLAHIQRLEHFTEQEANLVVVDITSALYFLHSKGIAHRDLKPENVLCSDPHQISPVKICDFDLSSIACIPGIPPQQATTPMLYTPVGSAEFMAPEVVETLTGETFSYDKKCDLWSLGVTLYIMLSGYPPFYGRCGNQCGWDEGGECDKCQDMLMKRIQNGHYEFPPEQWENVSEEAKDLISHLLVKDVNERYTADQVLSHPWIQKRAPTTPLDTPHILNRNPSITSELAHVAAQSIALHRTDSSQTLSRHNSGEINTFNVTSSSLTNGGKTQEESVTFVSNATEEMCLSSPESSELATRRAKTKWSGECTVTEKKVTFRFDTSSSPSPSSPTTTTPTTETTTRTTKSTTVAL